MSQSTEAPPLLDALRRRINYLHERVEELEELKDRVETLEARVPEPSSLDYDQMDKHDRATVIQSRLEETARSTNGKASMGYKDVIATFNGEPSPGYAYDLMELAGQGEGFNYGEDPDGGKRLTFNVTEV